VIKKDKVISKYKKKEPKKTSRK